MKIICLGNYPPRQCGIATFTENLVNSIRVASERTNKPIEIEIIAMNDNFTSYAYPKEVVMAIQDQDTEDYLRAANYINACGADLLLFQHEYGIYGGHSGLLVLNLLRRVQIPIISTFHTVLEKPSFHQKEVLKRIALCSHRIVIMNRLAIGFLNKIFEVPVEKILHIEHGTPDFEQLLIDQTILPLEWKNRLVMLTFGLLGRNKGIETVIRALPSIVANHPEVLYTVLGKTHPHVVKHAGEEYRESLKKLTRELNLEKHVLFLDEYVTENQLMQYLLACDIYVTPYLNKTQITSGTLCYAVGGGAAVISTPYWHAEELLDKGRGLLFDFKDHIKLAQLTNQLLDYPQEMKDIQDRAYNYGKAIAWPIIGTAYLSAFEEAVIEHHTIGHKRFSMAASYPTINLDHLKQLTDETGIIQHALGSIPDYRSGYCLDDNARALIVCVLLNEQSGSYNSGELITRYLAYLAYMQTPTGSFRNYLTYDRKIVEPVGSDDAYGRALWALGITIRYAPNESILQLCLDLFYRAVDQLGKLTYARGYANGILGLYHYIKRWPDQDKYIAILAVLADKLVALFNGNMQQGLPWFESSLTYDNGMMPAALYVAYEVTENQQYLEIAEKSRTFLESKCFVNEQLTLIGNRNWWVAHHPAESRYAQQPIDAMAMVILYDHAFMATRKEQHIKLLVRCFNWFLGENDLNLPLYNDQTNGCNDGLEEFNLNQNQGAESTIAFWLARIIADKYHDHE